MNRKVYIWKGKEECIDDEIHMKEKWESTQREMMMMKGRREIEIETQGRRGTKRYESKN